MAFIKESVSFLSYQPAWGGIDFSTSWNYQYSLNSVNDNNTYTRWL